MTTQHRAVFDATVSFGNGGGLEATGFRVDVPSPDVTVDDVARLFVTSLGLLVTESVTVRNLAIVEEAHRGTRGGPSDVGPSPRAAVEHVDLNHVVRDGEVTYPGLPAPRVELHLTREESRASYALGTEFQIDRITMVGNTGTYLDSPHHRYADGADLAGLALDRLVDLPAVVVRTAGSGRRAVKLHDVTGIDVAGHAVLLHTGGDSAWGRPEYAVGAPYLTREAATWLAEAGAVVVGIDAVNIDRIDAGGERPAHSALLAAGVAVVEHLTNLAAVPARGSRFTAVPPRVAGVGTFPVRAFATVPSPASAGAGDGA